MAKLKYILVLAGLLVCFTVAKYMMFSHNRASKLILPKADTVILGDSHARHALNPAFIDNSVNVSQDSQNIIYSYYVLNKLLEDGNHFQNVVLAYSYHSLGEYYLDLDAMEMMRRYHIILDADFYHNLADAGKQSAEMRTRYYADCLFMPLGISNDFYEMFQAKPDQFRSFSFIGGFEQNPKARLKPPLELNPAQIASQAIHTKPNANLKYLSKTIERHYSPSAKADVSPLTAMYLQRIAKLCSEHHITLYLVNTPLHPEYLKRIPLQTVNSVDSLAYSLEKKYYTVYLNYSNMLLGDQYYYDYDHLTTAGSKVFCLPLNRIISFISTGEFSYTPDNDSKGE